MNRTECNDFEARFCCPDMQSTSESKTSQFTTSKTTTTESTVFEFTSMKPTTETISYSESTLKTSHSTATSMIHRESTIKMDDVFLQWLKEHKPLSMKNLRNLINFSLFINLLGS